MCRPTGKRLSYISVVALIIAIYASCGVAQHKLCSRRYGTPLAKPQCEQALSHMPRGSLPSIFTTRPRTETNNFEQVPQRWVDTVFTTPACAITVDLDGHSIHDVFVLIPWDNVKLVAKDIIDECVGTVSTGGISTFGLNHSFEAIVHPAPYDPSINPVRVATVHVVNPDGSIDSVAIPAGSEDGINIPLYMTVVVSGPRIRPKKDMLDLWVGKFLLDYLANIFDSSTSLSRLQEIRKVLENWPRDYGRLLKSSDRRWWEYFTLNTTDTKALQTKISCTASLGKPSTASCESALFQLIRSGPVTLDPASRPLIQVSGNCAIAIETTSKQTTSWDTIRNIAESLLATCTKDPFSGVRGGYAVSHAVGNGLPKRQSDPNPSAGNLTVSMYLQNPFDGSPSDTCAWKAVSTHSGDVRQCPVPDGAWRPPERRLGDNGTRFAEWQKGNETAVQVGNWTETLEGNFSALVAAASSEKRNGRS